MAPTEIMASEDDPLHVCYGLPSRTLVPSTFIILGILGPHKSTFNMPTWKIKR